MIIDNLYIIISIPIFIGSEGVAFYYYSRDVGAILRHYRTNPGSIKRPTTTVRRFFESTFRFLIQYVAMYIIGFLFILIISLFIAKETIV